MSEEYKSTVREMRAALLKNTSPEERAVALVTFLACTAYAESSNLELALTFIDIAAEAAKSSLISGWDRVERGRQVDECAGEA